MSDDILMSSPSPVDSVNQPVEKQSRKKKAAKVPKQKKANSGSVLKDKKVIAITAIGVILFGIVLYIVISSTSTVKAVMLKEDQSAGTQITADMVEVVDVPMDTPGDFIRNENEVVGYTLKNAVSAGEFIYVDDFMTTWESYSNDSSIPDDYVITSIEVPDSQAVGGLIVAGDTIDIMGVSSNGVVEGFTEASGTTLNEATTSTERNEEAVQVYYILSNVKVINTNSALSTAQDNDLSSVSDDSNSSGSSYYIIALSYDDCKKLRQAEGIFDSLWLNIAPSQNQDNDPLINQMLGQSFSKLHNSQDPVQDVDGTLYQYDEKTGKYVKSDSTNTTDSVVATDETTDSENTSDSK
jgi:Flp pilus assembly protein CpaB